MTALGVLAGGFIGLGALCFTVVASDATLSFAAAQLLGGLAFSLGLILVVIQSSPSSFPSPCSWPPASSTAWRTCISSCLGCCWAMARPAAQGWWGWFIGSFLPALLVRRYNAASTSAACSAGFTCGQICLMRPSGPMRKVTRWMP